MISEAHPAVNALWSINPGPFPDVQIIIEILAKLVKVLWSILNVAELGDPLV